MYPRQPGSTADSRRQYLLAGLKSFAGHLLPR